MGSGSLNAMAVFEASYKEDMTQEEAEALVARAIRSGIVNIVWLVRVTRTVATGVSWLPGSKLVLMLQGFTMILALDPTWICASSPKAK